MDLIRFARYGLIIFDFHKTLTDSVYFDAFDGERRDRISDLVFRAPHNERWDKPWMTGRLRYGEVLAYLSGEIGLSREELEEGLHAGLGRMEWNRAVWDFSQAVRVVAKTAVATVNNDVFNRFIIGPHGLDRKFDVIINSFDRGTDDKTALCRAAAGELGLSLEKHPVLLIDDKAGNIDDFIAAGGEGYLYRGEGAFREWLGGSR